MSSLANQIADLSPEQLAQLTQRLKNKSSGIPPQSRNTDTFPLSFAQQRLWFLHQLQPEGSLTLPAAVNITGPLEVDRLRQCFQQLCDRHEPLRTSFVANEVGDPVQKIQVGEDWHLPIINLQARENPQQDVEQYTRSTLQQSFNLSAAPLLRTTLLRLSPQDHTLLFNAHHLIADGWSLGILIRELATFYASPQKLPPLPIQYADYTVWQRQHLQGQTLEHLLDYWQQKLQGVPTLFELPTDHPRPPIQSLRSGRVSLRLSTAETADLKQLAQQNNATPFMVGLAIYYVLLYRYTGRTDLLVGSPVANRNQVQTEGLMGVFVNTLALRTPIKPTWTFRQFLQQVRNGVAEANDHQDLPFESLIEVLAPERSPSYAPLLQVMFGLQADPSQPFACADLTFQPITLDPQTTGFDLVLQLFERQDSIHGWFEYSQDLFEADTIERMAGHWHVLLQAITAHPDQPMGQLDLLSPPEITQFQAWNQTQGSYPERCIHELIAQQAIRTPDGVAIVSDQPMSCEQQATAIACPDQPLTYRAFNHQANGLAQALQAQGLGPETLVGICLDRSPLLMVTILAVWKAGAAYIPLDPTYPEQRLQLMVADVQLVITQTTHTHRFPTCNVLDLNHLEWHPQPDAPKTQLTLDHLAYVIYTSGSTGKPKGVMLTHRGLANLSKAQQERFQVTPDSQVIQFASASFDASVWEMVMTWCAGATLHLGTSDELLPGPPLQTFLQRRQITHATLPPTALTPLNPDAVPTLTTLITAGEACSAALVRAWRPGRQFFNAYGPTETTICATVQQVEKNAPPAIGTPIANTQVYILDHQFQQVPVGVPGELYVSSVGLARGYLHRPGLTAASFVPNPFSAEPGARLYRTGDLACYGIDGAIAFLGRLDHQVKLRGLRIELGEIEARLHQHPAISQAVVIADEQLLAYCVSDIEVSATELRPYLEAILPSYMVPGQFVFLEALPLLPNGKVNRKALPAPDPQSRAKEQVAPRNATESTLVKIWQHVLQQDNISVDDHFFECGGHSLLATQLMTQIQAELGVSLPLRQIFETPTLAGLATYLQTQSGTAGVPIPSISRTDPLPLSFAQQRLWFLEQLESTGAAYHITTQLHLHGTLHLSALRQSLEQIIARHEILRTRFVSHKGQPSLEIDPSQPLDLAVVDLQQLPANEQAVTLEQMTQQGVQATFDLEQGPLLKVKLVQLEPEKSVALVTLHHIIADGQSTQIFLQELLALYQAFSTGQAPQLPTLPVQYVDYAHWQRQLLQDDLLQTQLDYWQQQLTPLPPVLELPCDRNRPPTQTFAGDTFSFTLSEIQGLRALAQSTGTTVNMVLLAIFKVLLYRYTGQPDVTVGSPIVHRHHADLENLMGFFTNTLVLRTDLGGTPSFRDLLQRVKSVALDAYAHADLPFEKLIEHLPLPRDLSHSPLFQVMFAHQKASTQLAVPGLTVNAEAVSTHTAKFDLTLTIIETEDAMTGVLEYNTDLFAPGTIERLSSHYQILLAGILEDPDQRINALPLLTSAELARCQPHADLLPKWTAIHHWFESQVAQTPDAIALTFESASLTYADLNAKANQLAHYLVAQGIMPENRVGLLLHRGPAIVMALLAVLKVGGVYIPLDPAYPQDRLQYMVRDGQVNVLLTDHPTQIEAPALIEVGAEQSRIAQHSPENLALEIFPEQLAYIIYTSGSTGQPKGVQITHQAVINFLQAHGQQPGINPSDVLLAVTSLSFDIAVLELLLPLVTGAQILLASRDVTLDGMQLAARLQQATIMQATPATWRLLLASGWTGQPQLKILSGGEALSPDLAYQLQSRGSELWNLYGPTETTIWSTQQAITESINIGRPIANTQVYILDPHLQPVPTGVTGELYISGLGLARGYHQRPGLSAEKFIPDPFSTAGARMYCTGDLARYQADGSIQHLGRRDHQVKVRGFRIELGEIEAHLNQHPLIAQAIAMAEGESLVAYGQLSNETEPTLGELHNWLRHHLPDYMVPTRFVWVSEFPLTPNGKIDRRALSTLDVAAAAPEHTYVPPQTETEKQLAQIWQEILGVEQVGLQDNFFELGGHSLLATQVVSRIRDQFSVELPLQSLFRSPAISDLVPLIATASPLVSGALVPVSRQQSLPLSFAQERLWFMDQLEPNKSAYNEPGMVVLDGHLDRAALQASLDQVIERHEILRSVFPLEQGQPVQQIIGELKIEIPLVDLQDLSSSDQEQGVERLAIANAKHPFNLANGPLLVTALLCLAPDKHVLLFTMHHIIADGWSKGVLIQDLSQIYTGFVTETSAALPPLPIQYADFAAWQRQQDLDPQLNYWRRQLGGDLPTLNLPLDTPRSEMRSQQGATYSIPLSPKLSESLHQLSQQESTTLFMTLLAGFKLLLSCHTQQRDIVVGTDVANRNRSEVEGLIGFFVNLLVLRTDLSGNPSFKELLQRIKTVALDAYNHQDLPFAKLVNVLQPERQAGVMPLFQVLFVLQNAPMPAIELPDLTLTPTQPDTQTAKFDLALFIQDTPDNLIIHWNYSTDVFQATTIERLAKQYLDLLQQVVTAPETQIETLTQPSPSKRKRFQRVKTQAVAPTEVVDFSALPSQIGLYQPQVSSVNLAAWAAAHRQPLEQQLHHYGALLFRGFDLPDAQAFEQVAGAICPQLFGEYGDLPRTGVSGKVYGSTPYPEDRAILFHNESSHLEQWPMKIWFFCVQPAQAGGETPIVDCRQVYQQLSSGVRDRIYQKQLMYERNFVPGLDVDWRDFFQTADRTAIKHRCQANGVECTWLDHDGLQTRQVRDAIAQHPHTQEWVFFNQLQLHHFSYIDANTQASIRSLLGGECLPRQVYYGDGSEIEPDVLAEINAAYDACAQQFTWQQGDVLMLDNMLMAHGRRAFQGPRQIVVALGQMLHQSQLAQNLPSSEVVSRRLSQ